VEAGLAARRTYEAVLADTRRAARLLEAGPASVGARPEAGAAADGRGGKTGNAGASGRRGT
jgi:hypothetical protein